MKVLFQATRTYFSIFFSIFQSRVIRSSRSSNPRPYNLPPRSVFF